MLTAAQLDLVANPLLDLFEQFNASVIDDIARRLARLDFATPTAAWQMQRLVESGAVYENAIKELAYLTGRSEVELRAIFTRAGVKAMRFDDSLYRAAGLNPMPLNLSPAMVQTLAAGLRKTQGVLRNLTMTSAMNAEQAFIGAADLAYLQVTTGALDYDTAIRNAVKDVAGRGLTVMNYASGRKDQLDVAMRRAVLTGVNQTAANLQLARAEEMGQDLVQTSAHAGARPEHVVWQGQIFSRSGTSRKYPPFVESTGYGSPTGLCGINCRHSFYPFFAGISQNAYDEATRDELAGKTVTYQGEPLSLYDATQKQREIERKIRLYKRQAGALQAAGKDNQRELEKVKAWQAKMRSFLGETGLQRQGARERI